MNVITILWIIFMLFIWLSFFLYIRAWANVPYEDEIIFQLGSFGFIPILVVNFIMFNKLTLWNE
jgi:hypothetical protein